MLRKQTRLVSEFGAVCELIVNVGKTKVMRCSRYVNVVQMDVRLNGEPLGEVDCLKYLRSQVAADVGCEMDVVHRMNDWYKARRAPKNVLSNRVFGINAK